jgi:hypothetical protein
MDSFVETSKTKFKEARIPEARWDGLIATARQLASTYGMSASRMVDGIVDNHRRKLHK